VKALLGWGWLELKEGWRSWFTARPASATELPKKPPAAMPS
jgi:hypothetical protein